MNRWRLFLVGVLFGTLCACAAQQTDSSPATTSSTASSKEKTAPIEVTNLPCAVVDSTESVTIRYPAESLYRGGAVLPKEEGLACLEMLTDWLKKAPQSKWQVTVSGEEGLGFEPVALSGKRQELLQRFFTRKGIEIQNWEWQSVAGQDVQLQLVEVKDLP
jgi:hypothetical protein